MDIKINILNKDVKIPEDVIQAANGDELIARIFFNRGYKTPEIIRQMLNEELYVPMKAFDFPRMDEAVDCVVDAIESNQLIAVYGDYDVDGVTSTVTLVQCLQSFTEKVIYHVPDRFFEGYGMNEEVIRSFADKGVALIITCDCGISNYNEVELAKNIGMKVVITDHHKLPDKLPKGDVILNPKLLPEGHNALNLPGCGMAYFLAIALFEHYKMENKNDELLDLLALALVADVVSLNGENRYLLKKALPVLFNTKRIGLPELFSIIKKTNTLETEEDIAFQIAPRINAAGRMDTAKLPVELFLCNDKQKAADMAQKIDVLNSERKRIQQDIIKQAEQLVENKKKNKTILVLFNEHWHHGIIGIAAGKIAEMYRKPAILLATKEDGYTVVGSARSTDGIDIYELLRECTDKLLKFGGHSMAAGLSLKMEDVEVFTSEIERLAEKHYSINPKTIVNADAELTLGQIDESLYNRLLSAGPYGEGFEPPKFVTKNISVMSDRRTERNHHIMVLAGENGVRLSAVKWFGEATDYAGKICDIYYKLGKNTHKGNSKLQPVIEYLNPEAEKTGYIFTGRFIDKRGAGVIDIINEYEDISVFYEGLGNTCKVENTINRYTTGYSKNLL
jgi:single-stranded-DNA-specific exonuclease